VGSFVGQAKLRKDYQHYDTAMFDYMLYTNAEMHNRRIRCKAKFFWDEDIADVAEQWNRMKQATLEDDLKAFEEWKKERLEYIEAISKVNLPLSFRTSLCLQGDRTRLYARKLWLIYAA